MKPRIFYTEAAYMLGIAVLALGTALMEAAGFGVSMVVAPAYLIHLKLATFYPFFTFGMAEYTLQALLLVALAIVLHRFRVSYLFSFGTAVLYGMALDGMMLLVALLPCTGTGWRLTFYLIGLLCCAMGVSLFFHSYISPEAYELFVKELSAKLGMEIHRFKTAYDCISCAVGVALSFAFFGWWHLEGVELGTMICALVNGWCIAKCSALLEQNWRFIDALPWRPFFESRDNPQAA